MATPQQVRRRGRWSLVLGTIFAFAAFAAVAYADNVQNDVAASTGIVTVTAGGSGSSVGYRINANNGDDENGCNASVASPATVTPSGVPVGVTSSPSSQQFTSCANTYQYITFTAGPSVAPGDYPIGATVTDSGAGSYNTSPANFTLRVVAPADTTPPSVQANVAPLPNLDGWNNGTPVQLTWTISDAQSATSIVSGCVNETFSSETAGETRSCTASSAGGQTTQSVTIKIDATSPLISSITGGYVSGSWTNQNVTISFGCADTGSVASGIKTNTITGGGTYSAETAGTTVSSSGSCVDFAGNAASGASVSVKIDKTKPLITANTDGYVSGSWTNQDVTISFGCADTGSVASGIETDTVTGGDTYPAETGGTTVTSSGSCVDKAGNAADAASVSVKIDKTKPLISANTGTYVPGTWTNQNVTVAFSCADTGFVQSGLESHTVGGGGTISSESATAAGTDVTNSGSCADRAGNAAVAKTVNVKIDKTAPSVTCNTAVFGPSLGSVTATVSDPLSGAKTATVSGAATSPNGGTVALTGEDNAGNQTAASCAYHVVRGGFLAPIDSPPVLNVAKWGRVVPVKFGLIYDGVAVSDPGASVALVGAKINCTSQAQDAVEVYEAAGSANSGSAFRYTDPHWTYNLDTGGFAVNACYRLDVQYLGVIAGSYLLKVTK
jgi:hypothetical protein